MVIRNVLTRLVLLLALFLPSAVKASPPVFSNGFTSNGPTFLNEGAQWTGSLYINAIPDPNPPSITVNTTGAASHTYYLVGHDGASNCGSGHEGTSRPSTGATVTNSSTPQNNSIGPLPTNFLFYDILRDSTSQSIATCVAGGSTITDTGQASSAYTPPTVNTTNTINNAAFTNLNVVTLVVTNATVANATVTNGTVTTATVGTLNNNVGPLATTGHINEPSANQIIASRNAANTGDIAVLATDGSNEVIVGGSGASAVLMSNPVVLTEQAAPSGSSGKDVLWADSTAHALRFNPNNSGAQYIHFSAGIPTANRLPKATSTTAQFSDSSVSDNGTYITANEPLQLPEQTAPPGVTGTDVCWGDSTAHGLKCNFNGTGPSQLMVFNAPFVSGHCTQASVSGGVTTFVDSGFPCSPSATSSPTLWMGTSAGVIATNAPTAFIGFGQSFDLTIRTTEASAFSILPSPSASITIKNLFCNWPTVANNVTAVVRDTHSGTTNSTTLTCTNTTGATGCSDTSDTPTVAGGDYLDIKVSTTDNAHNSGNISCGFQINGA